MRAMKRCDCGCMDLGKDAKTDQKRETGQSGDVLKAKEKRQTKEPSKAGER